MNSAFLRLLVVLSLTVTLATVGCTSSRERPTASGQPAEQPASRARLFSNKTFEFEAADHWMISEAAPERLRIKSGSFLALLLLEPYLSIPEDRSAESECSRESVEEDADELAIGSIARMERELSDVEGEWRKDVAPELMLLGGPTIAARRVVSVLEHNYTIDFYSRCAVAIAHGEGEWTVGQLILSVQGLDGDIEREADAVLQMSKTLSIVQDVWVPWPNAIP